MHINIHTAESSVCVHSSDCSTSLSSYRVPKLNTHCRCLLPCQPIFVKIFFSEFFATFSLLVSNLTCLFPFCLSLCSLSIFVSDVSILCQFRSVSLCLSLSLSILLLFLYLPFDVFPTFSHICLCLNLFPPVYNSFIFFIFFCLYLSVPFFFRLILHAFVWLFS